jgi:hypothetical protein
LGIAYNGSATFTAHAAASCATSKLLGYGGARAQEVDDLPLNEASALQTLADTKATQGRPREAEPLARRALKIREKVIPDHPDTAYTLNQLAWSVEEQSRYEEAEPFQSILYSVQPEQAGGQSG